MNNRGSVFSTLVFGGFLLVGGWIVTHRTMAKFQSERVNEITTEVLNSKRMLSDKEVYDSLLQEISRREELPADAILAKIYRTEDRSGILAKINYTYEARVPLIGYIWASPQEIIHEEVKSLRN